jgi:hypothetical protein
MAHNEPISAERMRALNAGRLEVLKERELRERKRKRDATLAIPWPSRADTYVPQVVPKVVPGGNAEHDARIQASIDKSKSITSKGRRLVSDASAADLYMRVMYVHDYVREVKAMRLLRIQEIGGMTSAERIRYNKGMKRFPMGRKLKRLYDRSTANLELELRGARDKLIGKWGELGKHIEKLDTSSINSFHCAWDELESSVTYRSTTEQQRVDKKAFHREKLNTPARDYKRFADAVKRLIRKYQTRRVRFEEVMYRRYVCGEVWDQDGRVVQDSR